MHWQQGLVSCDPLNIDKGRWTCFLPNSFLCLILNKFIKLIKKLASITFDSIVPVVCKGFLFFFLHPLLLSCSYPSKVAASLVFIMMAFSLGLLTLIFIIGGNAQVLWGSVLYEVIIYFVKEKQKQISMSLSKYFH